MSEALVLGMPCPCHSGRPQLSHCTKTMSRGQSYSEDTLRGLFRRNAKTQHRKSKVRDGGVLDNGDRDNPAGRLERGKKSGLG